MREKEKSGTSRGKSGAERHHPLVDVKAVTFHRFSLKETGEGWRAFVILDI
ncbi:MAG: archease [Syntrophales bacterium]|nr:archease [Syntrophales bacterium]